MKAGLLEMHPIQLEAIGAETHLPFPVYLYLPLNDRYVPLSNPDDSIVEKAPNLKKYKVKELWVPDRYFRKIADLLEKKEVAAEATLTGEVLKDDSISSEEKAEVLKAISQDMISAMSAVASSDPAARQKAFQKCKEVADEILAVAAARDSVYDEIQALRANGANLEHSVVVGSIASMFAMSLGISDEAVLADIISAGLFHDIGLSEVASEVQNKLVMDFNGEEKTAYALHVQKSMDILARLEGKFHDRVLRMVREHHEHYDGSGYPRGLRGEEIDELSQILQMADWFDDLVLGRLTKELPGPADALDMVYGETMDPAGGPQKVNPELAERLFTFMLEEKEKLIQAQQNRKAE